MRGGGNVLVDEIKSELQSERARTGKIRVGTREKRGDGRLSRFIKVPGASSSPRRSTGAVDRKANEDNGDETKRQGTSLPPKSLHNGRAQPARQTANDVKGGWSRSVSDPRPAQGAACPCCRCLRSGLVGSHSHLTLAPIHTATWPARVSRPAHLHGPGLLIRKAALTCWSAGAATSTFKFAIMPSSRGLLT